MGLDSVWHWLLLLVIVLVIFGTGKLGKIGPDLGNAVRGFKKALQDGEGDTKAKPAPAEAVIAADPAAPVDATVHAAHGAAAPK